MSTKYTKMIGFGDKIAVGIQEIARILHKMFAIILHNMKTNSHFCIFLKFYANFIKNPFIILEYTLKLMYNAYKL